MRNLILFREDNILAFLEAAVTTSRARAKAGAHINLARLYVRAHHNIAAMRIILLVKLVYEYFTVEIEKSMCRVKKVQRSSECVYNRGEIYLTGVVTFIRILKLIYRTLSIF